MSSTSNSQNLLVNVFRPTYVYDSTNGYRPRLVLSNVDGVNGTSGTFSNLNVGDAKSNVYIGINTGNASTLAELCNSTGITAIGLSAGCNNSNSSNSAYIGNSTGCNTTNVTNSVYLGNSTGSFNSNCANSVYIGFNTAKNLSNASNEIAIGTNAIAGGVSNIYIGPSTGSSGSSNIFIGPNIAPGSGTSNELRIGRGNDIAIYGNLVTKAIGINTTNPTTGFDVSGEAYFSEKVGIQMVPTHSLDVAGQIYATDGILIGTGTAATPAIALSNDPDTGLFGYTDPAYGRTIGFSIGGQSKMTLTDTSGLSVFGDLYIDGTFSAAASTLASNTVLGGYIRAPDFTGSALDISAGGINTSSNISVGNNLLQLGPGSIVDTSTNGYIRMLNDSSVIRVDISGGNISNSATTRSSNFIGTSTSASNSIGGVTLSNNNISYSGTITGSTDNTSNKIGGVVLSNNTISNVSTSSNVIGGVTLSNTDISLTGRILGTNTTSNSIGGITLSNTRIGVGKTNPVVALEVVGDVSATTYNGPGGTAGAPHYTFSDDRTTGVFFPGANIVGLSAGGIERMRISNSNIGIGTTNPANALDVSGVLRIIGANGNITFSNGSIDVSGTPLVSSTGAFSNVSTTSNSIGGVLLSNGGVDVSRGSATIPSYSFLSDLSTGIHWNNVSSMGFDTSGIQRMCISGTNVGIGTSTPGFLLDVSGTIASANVRSSNYSMFSDVGAAGFDPRTIGGCVLWLDVSDSSTITSAGGTVSEWRDKSTSGNNFSQATSGNRPTLTSEGLISFSSGKSLASISNNATAGSASRTVIAVMRAAGGSDKMMFATGAGIGQRGFGFDANRGLSKLFSPFTIGYDIVFDSFTNGNTLIAFASYDSVTTTLSGRAITSTAGFGTLTSSNTTAINTDTTPWYLGSNFNGSSTNGLMYEFIQYNTALTQSQREQIEGYLAWKWGIQSYLPSGHPYSNSFTVIGQTLSFGADSAPNSSFFRFGAPLPLLDISGGNISNSKTLRTSNVITTSSTSSNSIGGITLSNQILDAPNSVRVNGSSLMMVNPTNLPTNAGGSLFIAGPYASPIAGRMFFGDGTGWSLRYASLNGGNFLDRFTFTDGGRLGIGTTSPQYALDVSDGISASTTTAMFRNNANQAAIRVAGNGYVDSSGLQLYHNSNNQGIFVNNTLPFYIWTNGTIRVDVSSSGDTVFRGGVRLGTATNDYKPFLIGGGNSLGSIYGDFPLLGDGVHFGYNYYISNGSPIIVKTDPATGTSRITAGYGTVGIYTGAANTAPNILGYYQNSVGRVGIGTSNPQRVLDVSFTGTTNGIRVTGSNAVMEVSDGRNAGAFQFYQNETNAGINVNDNKPIYFQTSTNSTRMCISGTNVGIGTVTPAYTLDVNGIIAANSNEYTLYITTNGTYNVPSGFTQCYITLVGGGGGGGTTTNAGGAGGGGGGHVVTQLITSPASFTFTRGTGGGSATAGGESTLAYSGITIRAKGGNAGSNSTTSNGANGGTGGYGGGGGGSSGATPGNGGTGKIVDGDNGTAGGGGNGGGGGIGRSGGGGGGPLGGAGGFLLSNGDNGGIGCGGGGAGGGATLSGGSGGNGYCILKFLR